METFFYIYNYLFRIFCFSDDNMHANHRLTVREVAEEIRMSIGSFDRKTEYVSSSNKFSPSFGVYKRLCWEKRAGFPTTTLRQKFIYHDGLAWWFTKVMRKNSQKETRDTATQLMVHSPWRCASLMRQFCGKTQMTVLPQSPHSPGLAPCDFFLSSILKLVLNKRVKDIPEYVKINFPRLLSEVGIIMVLWKEQGSYIFLNIIQKNSS